MIEEYYPYPQERQRKRMRLPQMNKSNRLARRYLASLTKKTNAPTTNGR